MSKFIDFWNKSSRPGQINNKTKLQIALPFMPVQLSNALIHSAYLKYYTDIIGLDIKYRGIVSVFFSPVSKAVEQELSDSFEKRRGRESE